MTSTDAIRDVIRSAGGRGEFTIKPAPHIEGAEVDEVFFRRLDRGDGTPPEVTGSGVSCDPRADRWVVTVVTWPGLLVCCTASMPNDSKFLADTVADFIPSLQVSRQ